MADRCGKEDEHMTWTSLSADKAFMLVRAVATAAGEAGAAPIPFPSRVRDQPDPAQPDAGPAAHRASVAKCSTVGPNSIVKLEATELKLQRFRTRLSTYGTATRYFTARNGASCWGGGSHCATTGGSGFSYQHHRAQRSRARCRGCILQSLANSHCDDLTQARARIIGRWPILIEQLACCAHWACMPCATRTSSKTHA